MSSPTHKSPPVGLLISTGLSNRLRNRELKATEQTTMAGPQIQLSNKLVKKLPSPTKIATAIKYPDNSDRCIRYVPFAGLVKRVN